MSKWKTKALSIVLGLSVLVPTAAFAADAVTTPADLPSGKFAQHQRFDSEQGQAARDNILDLVGKYAPDSMEEWQNVITEHEQLMNDLKEQAPAQRPEISDEVKEKLQAIREEVKNGTMTREQASVKLEELGLQGKRDLAGHNNIMLQLNEAVESGDESAIKDLLAQLLEQMQEKSQQLSDKLAEIN